MIQGGIRHGARPEQQAMSGQLAIDDLQNLRNQRVPFEQITKSQDADPVRNALGAANAYKVPVEAGLKKGSFGPKVGQSKPLLQAVDTQHHCQIKRWTPLVGHRRMERYNSANAPGA